MSIPQRIWPIQSTATEVGHHLVTGYIALTCAAIEAEHLVKLSPRYRGAVGWDLQTAILDASTAIENAVCVHDLARYSKFWGHPRDTTEADHARAALSENTATTTKRLVADLTNAFSALTAAARHAEVLIAADHYYGHSAGYIGGLGWDLETAVDDAVIAIRDAMRTGTLSEVNPTFWKPQL
ncbi:hypothetical protein BTO20_37505 (plasmid) [Mycobacterium dioxanotrophicus]|jgi:hypothetical protein|uniref:Uncharacterized protein n=1 Tax=Mycobacterium dioxanotrophicus TaxID=482462 RepID=A0A1Y0CGP1_9MYCO|nr:hypothetical protein [Mycobacterium dioxanotrophicus]ART74322.1 hypothetical protein BTO20_37505 [Mycobacterium dioxanotrophicus]